MSAATFQLRHPGLVWSNPQASEAVLIRAALLHPRFHTILDACVEFGRERVAREWEVLLHEAAPETRLVEAEVRRMLRHIEEGCQDADAAG